MGSARQPRGRLPRRVYWVRRSIVLAVAVLLVLGIGKLVGGTGQDSPDIEASTSSAQQSQDSSPGATLGPVAPSQSPRKKQSTAPLVEPSGECSDDEVSVEPSVPRAWGGAPIVVRLALRGLQPACTFTVSPESLVVKITSGKDRIWSSQDCPHSVPESEVVVRNAVATLVDVTWSGRRSDESCSSHASWALPGFYHVFAAAFGSTPTDVQFQVTRGAPNVVTRTPKPKPSQSPTAGARPSATPSASTTVSGKQSKCGGDSSATSC